MKVPPFSLNALQAPRLPAWWQCQQRAQGTHCSATQLNQKFTSSFGPSLNLFTGKKRSEPLAGSLTDGSGRVWSKPSTIIFDIVDPRQQALDYKRTNIYPPLPALRLVKGHPDRTDGAWYSKCSTLLIFVNAFLCGFSIAVTIWKR